MKTEEQLEAIIRCDRFIQACCVFVEAVKGLEEEDFDTLKKIFNLWKDKDGA